MTSPLISASLRTALDDCNVGELEAIIEKQNAELLRLSSEIDRLKEGSTANGDAIAAVNAYANNLHNQIERQVLRMIDQLQMEFKILYEQVASQREQYPLKHKEK